jgi:hypothetical protein
MGVSAVSALALLLAAIIFAVLIIVRLAAGKTALAE